jgi:hypothetical protein
MWDETRIEYGRNRFGLFSGRRIFWGAILAGVAVAFGVTLLLGFLGAGLGASSINPTQESNPFAGLGLGALIWMVVSGFIAFFAGGWLSAYGGGSTTRTAALAHGFTMWAVATVLGMWILTGAAGTLVSGGAGIIGGAISTGTQAATTDAGELSPRVREELRKRGIDPESIRQQAESPEARARAEQLAREAGQTIAYGVSKAALGGFAMLLLNLFASLLGAASVELRYPGETTTVTERVA